MNKEELVKLAKDIVTIIGEHNSVLKLTNESVSNYEVSVELYDITHGDYTPKRISFSLDHDAGYFMDIDGVTWEFDNNYNEMATMAHNYAKAAKNGLLYMECSRFLGLFTYKRILKIRK